MVETQNCVMTKEELTFRLVHSSAGGRHDALQRVVNFLRFEAGKYFADGNDDHAKVARDLANIVDRKFLRDAGDNLQWLIKETEVRREGKT